MSIESSVIIAAITPRNTGVDTSKISVGAAAEEAGQEQDIPELAPAVAGVPRGLPAGTAIAQSGQSESGEQEQPRPRVVQEDKVEISEEAKRKQAKEAEPVEGELTEEDKEQIEQLRARDLEVRAHEAAHLQAAGSLAKGGAKFDYQKGPDNKSYAVGGHVDISLGKGKTPEETIQRAEQIKRAALAPANPSGKDRQVAARASKLQLEAQEEIQTREQEQIDGAGPKKPEEEGQPLAEGEAERPVGPVGIPTAKTVAAAPTIGTGQVTGPQTIGSGQATGPQTSGSDQTIGATRSTASGETAEEEQAGVSTTQTISTPEPPRSDETNEEEQSQGYNFLGKNVRNSIYATSNISLIL